MKDLVKVISVSMPSALLPIIFQPQPLIEAVVQRHGVIIAAVTPLTGQNALGADASEFVVFRISHTD